MQAIASSRSRSKRSGGSFSSRDRVRPIQGVEASEPLAVAMAEPPGLCLRHERLEQVHPRVQQVGPCREFGILDPQAVPAELPGRPGRAERHDRQQGRRGGRPGVALAPPPEPLRPRAPPRQDRTPLQEPPQLVGQRLRGGIARRPAPCPGTSGRWSPGRGAAWAAAATARPARRRTWRASPSALGLERRPAGKHLVEDRAQGVDVGGRADLRSSLPRPARGPCSWACPASSPVAVAAAAADRELGQAEVGDLGRAVGGQQDIGRGEVAVDDAQEVGRVDGPRSVSIIPAAESAGCGVPVRVWASERPSTSSRTRKGAPACTPTPWICTMLAWRSRARASASTRDRARPRGWPVRPRAASSRRPGARSSVCQAR